jgi:hypothetical protein
MRILLRASFPNEPFNSLVRKGTAGDVMNKIMTAIKPEAVYFTEIDGQAELSTLPISRFVT